MSSSISVDPRTGRRTPGDADLRLRDERLESLKAVAGKLAHDFNNFLAPQYGYITLLKDEVSAGSTQAAYVTAMESSALKTESYIASILVGMRPHRQFAPREFALDKMIYEVLERWRTDAPGEIDIASELDPAPLFGDEKQLRIVLEQLLSNARYALAMGGRLSVTLRAETLPADELERLGLGTNEVFCLQVSDTGFGMTPDVLRRAFEPFFTTRTLVKASGLGLTIVHGITLYHGGQIELESAEDGGTTVTLWLPARRFESARIESAARKNAPALRKALLIADDPLMKEILRGWLARHELETETAATEKEARRILQRTGANCALILCEADLKGARGEDFFRALSDFNSPALWVFLCAKRVPDLPHIAGREDPLLMKKPFSHSAFSEIVRNYTNR